MATPSLSIITATKDALDGLRLTSNSVEAQTYRNFEHIVGDGGSSDGSREWLESNGDIRWISEADSGISDALNKGVELAIGEWILVLHAEDTLLDERTLEHALPHLETSADLVSFNVLFTTTSGDRTWKSRGMTFYTNFKTTIPHQGVFTRRALFDRVGEFDTHYRVAMDYEFLLRAYRKGVTADVIDRVLTRMPDTGVSSRRDWASLRQRFAEERKAHLAHAVGLPYRAMYGAYWPLYGTYRRARSLLIG